MKAVVIFLCFAVLSLAVRLYSHLEAEKIERQWIADLQKRIVAMEGSRP